MATNLDKLKWNIYIKKKDLLWNKEWINPPL